MRLDYRLLESEEPDFLHDGAGRRSWEQEIEGTPFERVLDEAITEVAVIQAVGGGTEVTLERRQRLRDRPASGAG